MFADFVFEKRVSVSWVSSAALHAIFLGLYLIFGPKEKTSLTVISEVEFWEPDLDAPMEPKESLSRKVFDFLQVALPSKETKPKELPSLPIAAKSADLDSLKTPQEKLELKKNSLADKLSASLNLENKLVAEAGPKSLANLALPANDSRSARLAAAQEPKIELSKASGGESGVSSLAEEEGKISLSKSKLGSGIESLSQTKSRLKSFGPALDQGDLNQDEGLPSVPIFNKPRAPGPVTDGAEVLESARVSSRLAGAPAVLSLDSAEAAPIARKAQAALNQVDINSRDLTEISGPIRNRKIVKFELPEYPAWAKAKGIQAQVVLYFSVAGDGRVNKSIKVQRTSGWSELDALALKALAQWAFAPIEKEKGDQWGYATFRYILE